MKKILFVLALTAGSAFGSGWFSNVQYSTITKQYEKHISGSYYFGGDTTTWNVKISSTGEITAVSFSGGASSATYAYTAGTATYSLDSDKLDNHNSLYFAVYDDVIADTSTLRTDLTAETNNRISGDNDLGYSTGVLSGQINSLQSQVSSNDSDIADLGYSTGTIYSALQSTGAALSAETTRATDRENDIAVSTGTNYSAINSTAAALTSEISRAKTRENNIAYSTGTNKALIDINTSDIADLQSSTGTNAQAIYDLRISTGTNKTAIESNDSDISALGYSTGTLLTKSSATATYLNKLNKAADSDLLDGLDNSAFGKLSSTQTWTGENTFNNTIFISSSIETGSEKISMASGSIDIQSSGDVFVTAGDFELYINQLSLENHPIVNIDWTNSDRDFENNPILNLDMQNYKIKTSSSIEGVKKIVWADGTVQVSSPTAGGGTGTAVQFKTFSQKGNLSIDIADKWGIDWFMFPDTYTVTGIYAKIGSTASKKSVFWLSKNNDKDFMTVTIVTGAYTGEISTNAVYVKNDILGYYVQNVAEITNLLNNPSFETDFTSWTKIGTAANIVIDSTYFYDEAQSVRFVDPASGYSYRGIVSSNTTCSGDFDYELQAHFYVRNEGAGAITDTNIRLYVEFYDSGGTLLDTQGYMTAQHLSAFDNWQGLSYTGTSPATTAYANVYIDCSESPSNDNDVYVDLVKFGEQVEVPSNLAITVKYE